MNQYFDPNGYSPLSGMGQRYDPVLERAKLFQSLKNSIAGRPMPPASQSREALVQKVAGGGQPAPQTAAQGAIQGATSIVNGLALRQHDRGPFPEMPGGGQPGFFQGLANMFGRGGGLY